MLWLREGQDMLWPMEEPDMQVVEGAVKIKNGAGHAIRFWMGQSNPRDRTCKCIFRSGNNGQKGRICDLDSVESEQGNRTGRWRRKGSVLTTGKIDKWFSVSAYMLDKQVVCVRGQHEHNMC